MSTLTRWNPFREMMSLRDDMDRLFEDVLGANQLQWRVASNWGLPLDVTESDEHFIVKASIPGVNPDNLDITLANNTLTIKGEVKGEETVENERYHLRERRYGSFTRSLNFPVPVNADNIEATYEHGVLSLRIAKSEEVKPKRIAINAGSNGRKVIEGNR